MDWQLTLVTLLADTSLQDTMWGVGSWVWRIFQVVVGVGMVIFVHELGHFLVAKWCGVKCEQFFLGFCPFGLKICSFQWGETEYGIGVLPLGGYVKMLGQDDNPNKMHDEIERSKAAPADGAAATSPAPTVSPVVTGPTVPTAPVYDPRSYLAKSVPQRMAIISAGVIMNVIFAFVVTFFAYLYGVHTAPSNVSYVTPGSPAWKAGLEVGDEFRMIGNRKDPNFIELKRHVALWGWTYGKDGIPTHTYRPTTKQDFHHNLVPEYKGLMPILGVVPAQSLLLGGTPPARPNTPAALEGGFKTGDVIVAVDGKPTPDFATFYRLMATVADQTAAVTVRRVVTPAGEGKPEETKEITVDVPKNPLKDLGVVMALGTVSAIQEGSPAAQAGLRSEDFLISINGQPVGDPMTLPLRVRALAGQEIELLVKREGKEVAIKVTPRPTDRWLVPLMPNGNEIELPALGICYKVLDRIAAVVPADQVPDPAAREILAQPAIRTRLQDAEIESAQIISADPNVVIPAIEFKEDEHWLGFYFGVLQDAGKGVKVKLKLKNSPEPVTLIPFQDSNYANADRGFVFMMQIDRRQADSLGHAWKLACDDTLQALIEPYLVIGGMIGQKISPKNLGGPLRIFSVAGNAADMGFGDLLLFLAMLSANLAVINSLPIPILDGGHMVFLTWELIFRKPASEQVLLVLHLAGLCFILGLMCFVLYLDGTWVLNIKP